MNRDLNCAYKPLKRIILQALKIAKKRGLNVIITSVWRSAAEQYVLWVQGRKNLAEVNRVRAKVGLSKITKEQNKKITWTTKKSYHTCVPKSMAVDFCIVENKKAIWDVKADVNDNEIPDYKEFANICKSLDSNIEWGGDWKRKDYGHIQWKNGININQNEKINDKIDMEKEKQNLFVAIGKLIGLLFKRFKK